MTSNLLQIAEFADEEVLNSLWAKKHAVVLVSQISQGGCELWANAVVKRLPGSKKVWLYGHGHCMVEWNGYQFDSDTDGVALREIGSQYRHHRG